MDRRVSNWLFLGVILILIQIFIGGVTRLTGSGLSITKWEIVVGTLPPLNESDWQHSFDLYKETPQYEKINQGMSLSEFKFIYFWEYIHRLWARVMGLVFIVPFMLFYKKGLISRPLLKRLFIVFLLALTVAIFGWIMVASGLVDRPWVNAYKLSMHLGLALVLILYLFDTWHFSLARSGKKKSVTNSMFMLLSVLVVLLPVQIILGGVLSGMRAALIYPSWPRIGTDWIPPVLLNLENWNLSHFLMYDRDVFMPALVHFLHRNLGYIIALVVLFYSWITFNKGNFTKLHVVVVTIIVIQVLLGILVLLNSVGVIPLWLGVFHQLIAFILTLVIFYLYKESTIRQH
jgi:heme a synthase